MLLLHGCCDICYRSRAPIELAGDCFRSGNSLQCLHADRLARDQVINVGQATGNRGNIPWSGCT